LAAEYRKVASQAAARGDHRRAAYIHAKLLGDMRSAANVLQQGGLFHDAAILYLKVLRDPRAAAAAFEAGGECDRALALYLEMGQLLQAAELLRRAGDEERALTYFEQAAQECISRNGDYLAAGDLMRSKAGRADLAQEYYEQGWVNRPAKNDMLCATALARAFAAQESAPDLRRLLTEAEQSLAAGGRDKEAADFFNEVARLASAPGLIRARDELRDQCLIALAGLLRERLRQETKPGKVVSNLLGASGTWDAAVVSDADFAWKAGLRERAVAPRPRQRSLTRLRFETGRVTAVCSAPGTGHLVLGFENGAIGCFDPVSGRWLSVEQPRSGSPVVSLATTMEGNVVVARSEPASDTKPLLRGNPRKHPVLTVSASQPASSSGALRSYALDSSAGYRLKAELPWEDPATLMAPLIVHYYGAPLCLIVKENQFWKFDANSLVWISQVELFHESGDCDDLMFLPVASHDLAFPVLILRTGATIWCCSAISRTGECRVGQLGWSPGFVEEEVLRGKPWNSILQSEHIVETAGLGTDGFIHHSELDLGGSQLRIRSSTALGQFNGCLAVCPIRAGLVAAIMPDRIVWFQTTFPSLHLQHTFETDCKGTLACFRSARTDELLIVFQDGEIARVAVPS
jgi:tetratricopeptide (TPR) repeat protein